MKRLWWYIGPLKIQIAKELDTRLDLVIRLGHFKSNFIAWCANQRVIYEPDLDDEVTEFKKERILKRLENINVDLWREVRNRIFTRDNFTCQYCKQIGHCLEIDHIIPISKGGANNDNNLITACRRCNRQKRDKGFKEFLSLKKENHG